MVSNFAYSTSRPGLFKIVTLVLGIISWGCAAGSFDKDEPFEKFFLGASITAFLISLIYFAIYLLSYNLSYSRINVGIDIFFHIAAAGCLFGGASLMIISAKDIKNWDNDIPAEINIPGSKFSVKVAGAAFGIINGIVYLATGLMILTYNPDDNLDPIPEKRYET